MYIEAGHKFSARGYSGKVLNGLDYIRGAEKQSAVDEIQLVYSSVSGLTCALCGLDVPPVGHDRLLERVRLLLTIAYPSEAK